MYEDRRWIKTINIKFKLCIERCLYKFIYGLQLYIYIKKNISQGGSHLYIKYSATAITGTPYLLCTFKFVYCIR